MEEETTSAPSLSPKNILANSRNMVLAIGAIAVVGVGAVGYFWWQSSQTTDPAAAAQKEANELVALVSKLIVLPSDEEPVIATVADPARLQDTPFFEKAKIGDRVLIYNKARKAILYDPKANVILEVAPLNIQPTEEQ